MDIPKSMQKFISGLKGEDVTKNLNKLEKEYSEDRAAEIQQLLSDGVGPSKIAKMFGVSKQRVNQISNPSMARAHSAVQVAISNGSLVRLPCRVCGDLISEAHHEDYSKPLDVVWLCKTHHAQADAYRRATGR